MYLELSTWRLPCYLLLFYIWLYLSFNIYINENSIPLNTDLQAKKRSSLSISRNKWFHAAERCDYFRQEAACSCGRIHTAPHRRRLRSHTHRTRLFCLPEQRLLLQSSVSGCGFHSQVTTNVHLVQEEQKYRGYSKNEPFFFFYERLLRALPVMSSLWCCSTEGTGNSLSFSDSAAGGELRPSSPHFLRSPSPVLASPRAISFARPAALRTRDVAQTSLECE